MDRKGRARPNNDWSLALFDKERRAIGDEIKRLAGEDGGRKARLKLALDGVVRLEHDDSSRGRMRRYIYVMYALVQHERGGGLARREIDQLLSLAYGILRAQGLVPKKSRLARLYGDLHMVRSQIFRNEGLPWEAAWEHELAAYLAGSFPSGYHGFPAMVSAARLLRLGHAPAALDAIADALTQGLADQDRGRALLLRAQCLMFMRRAEEAMAACTEVQNDASLQGMLVVEGRWQKHVITALGSQDFRALLRLVKTDDSFKQAGYVIEACMWNFASQTLAVTSEMPSLANLRRRTELKPLEQGEWLRTGETLQQCYDTDIPLVIRLSDVSERMRQRSNLLTVDKELLAVAAILRWLLRSHATGIAALVRAEYQALSLRLTGGAMGDALSLFDSLKEAAPEGAA